MAELDKGKVIQAVQSLAIQLTRSPKMTEVQDIISRHNIQKHFGGFSILLQSANLKPYREPGARKIDNTIWEKDIEQHLADYQPRPYTPPGPYPTAALISDIHWPFSCQRVIDAFLAYVEKHKPEWVIINGDAWDMYSHSKYPRSLNVFTPREEQRLAREANETFWKEVQRRSPKSKCVQLMGNHDIRPLKRVLETYPEAEDWVAEKLNQLFTFDGVKTFMDAREELFLNEKVIVFHGYRSKLGDHRDYTLLSCFNGHTHTGGDSWRKLRNELIFECNSGVAGDPESKGLTYTPQKITHWTPGFAAMDEYGPRFIPA